MAKVIGHLCAPTGKYIKDGQEKTSWTKCGILMETEKGFRVKLDTVPVGGQEQGIWFSVFDPDPPQSKGSAPKAPSSPSQEVDKDQEMPF